MNRITIAFSDLPLLVGILLAFCFSSYHFGRVVTTREFKAWLRRNGPPRR